MRDRECRKMNKKSVDVSFKNKRGGEKLPERTGKATFVAYWYFIFKKKSYWY
jgi:hypothetical protein